MASKSKTRKTKTIRLITNAREERYQKLLEKITDDIFEKATYDYDWSWSQLAKKSGCTYRTIRRLGYRMTNPMLRTVVKLAEAVNMDLQLVSPQLQINRGRKRKAG